MSLDIDLHCHSTASDGALPPADVVRRAAARGVKVLALTDHDQLDGLESARQAADETGIRFIDGVEISVTWRGQTIHVVGLNITAGLTALGRELERVRSGRLDRARRMADDLAAAGVTGAYEGALRYTDNPRMISRTHFARYLVEAGVVRDTKAAFQRFLVPGKPGYIPIEWAQLGDAVRWIVAAGGQAVLAHPGRYSLSAGALEDLVGEFKQAGGEGIEVVTSSHSPDQYLLFAEIARKHGLAASRGSDFHGPGEGGEFGSLPPLDPALPAIWDGWVF
jgi:predicted metal-dependent phosphoesterase TrpH